MNTLSTIKKRRSIRKYKDDPVPLDLIGAVIEAAVMAPSAGNQQMWKFIVVQNEEKRKAIAEACLEQYWMSRAPVHIVIVAEDENARKWYGVRGEKLYSIQTCAAAVENLILAAEELGLATCWVGAFEEGIVSRICGIPESARPQAVITLGYPDETPRKKTVHPLERVIFLESFGSRISDLSPFFWDWSVVAEKEISGAAKGISDILKKNLEKHRKKIKTKWEKLQKKIDEKIRRPLNQ